MELLKALQWYIKSKRGYKVLPTVPEAVDGHRKAFHLMLFRPLQNDVLLSLLEAIWAVDDGFELEKKQPHLEQTITKHEAIVAALENHSYPALARAMDARFSSGKYLGMTSYEEY